MQLLEMKLAYRMKESSDREEIVINSLVQFGDENVSLIPETEVMTEGSLLRIRLMVKDRIEIDNFQMRYRLPLQGRKMMVNGFQTWSQSREMGQDDRLKNLRSPGALFGLKPYGDYSINNYQQGNLHSFTYTYIREENGQIFLLGSLDESSGYTIFSADFKNENLTIAKDLQGLELQGEEYQLLDLYHGKGVEQNLFTEYLNYFPGKRREVEKCTGWTSWYNYYTKITEEIVVQNLQSLEQENIPLDFVQIDDGYQQAVGDWLLINEKFPSGMKYLAEKIRAAGYRTGLWLAPFVCEKKSTLFREHPEWLLRDKQSRPVKAGWNPGWSGTFYALDLYNQQFRQYLKEVFKTVLTDWGYDMVKLDFLYAAALQPRSDKSRGQIMTEAVSFLREISGEGLILGCGVPLGPAFKQFEYCRIGSDVAPYWEDRPLKFLRYRERVSTINSLYSTLSRWQLNGRAFHNDPDVFMLRSKNNRLTAEQKYTLFIINNLLGGLVFFSDDIGKYTEKELQLFKSMFPRVEPLINKVREDEGLYRLEFEIEGRNYLFYTNTGSQERKVVPAEGEYYSQANHSILREGQQIRIKPHQSICLMKIKDEPVSLAGTTGHLFAGSELAEIICQGNMIEIKLKADFQLQTTIYLLVREEYKSIVVNGKEYTPEERDGKKIVSISYG